MPPKLLLSQYHRQPRMATSIPRLQALPYAHMCRGRSSDPDVLHRSHATMLDKAARSLTSKCAQDRACPRSPLPQSRWHQNSIPFTCALPQTYWPTERLTDSRRRSRFLKAGTGPSWRCFRDGCRPRRSPARASHRFGITLAVMCPVPGSSLRRPRPRSCLPQHPRISVLYAGAGSSANRRDRPHRPRHRSLQARDPRRWRKALRRSSGRPRAGGDRETMRFFASCRGRGAGDARRARVDCRRTSTCQWPNGCGRGAAPS